jgi:hypothetical protein
MADITGLLAKIRQETPPAVPYDPDAAGQLSSEGRTADGAPSEGAAAALATGDPEGAAGTDGAGLA